MRIGLAWVIVSSAWLAACGDNSSSVPSGIDAAEAPDADPNVPDADPNVSDADPNAPDAARAADASTVDAPVADGVRCGDVMCAVGDQCCLRNVGPTITPTCQTPGDGCNGNIYLCDGREDCGGNDCCLGGTGNAACGDGTPCDPRVCNTPDDCNTGEMCCPPGGPSFPWTYDTCVATPTCPG